MNETNNYDLCYCNSEKIVQCSFQYSNRCPRVCRLFNDENEMLGLERLFKDKDVKNDTRWIL